MKKRPRRILIPALILIALLILEIVYYRYFLSRKEPIRQISLIVYGSDASRFENLKQGAEQAAADLNAEVTLITMSSENDAMEQVTLIRREIMNGADALLIAACDSEAVGEYLKNDPINIPYAFVETGIDNDRGAPAYAADDKEMAKALVDTIEANEKDWIKVAVIADHTERISVRDRIDTIVDSGLKCDELVLWERNEQEKDKKAQFFLQRELTEEAVDVVVAVDNSSMEELLDAKVNLNKDIKIYGIADSSKSVYYLDHGLIKSLICQDEFSEGYLAVENILGGNAGNTAAAAGEGPVRFETVNRDNMYDMAYQKMLFPHLR